MQVSYGIRTCLLEEKDASLSKLERLVDDLVVDL